MGKYGKIARLHGLLSEKKISCTELTKTYLGAIEKDNGALNAYVKVTPEAALETAARVDAKIAAGEPLAPLEGIPMTLKDNISTKGHRNDLLLQNAGKLCADLRRDRLEPAEKTKRRPARQGQHGRVRHGLLVRNLLLRRGEEPARHQPRGRRQQRRRGFRL
jgi:hypothetical protein